MQRPDGEPLWVRVRHARGLEDDVGAERHLVLQDISLQKKIQVLSERDALTGTYNRMKFDQLLQEALSAHFSALLQSKTRATDQLARWGGEEFVVLLPMAELPEAIVAAEKLRQAMTADGWPVINQLTASFGVAAHAVQESADDLLDRVDAALYKAKENGRNRVYAAEPYDGEHS